MYGHRTHRDDPSSPRREIFRWQPWVTRQVAGSTDRKVLLQCYKVHRNSTAAATGKLKSVSLLLPFYVKFDESPHSVGTRISLKCWNQNQQGSQLPRHPRSLHHSKPNRIQYRVSRPRTLCQEGWRLKKEVHA